MNKENIYWLAGILEGEAWFGWKRTPALTLQMTDEDIVQRVSNLFERPYYKVRSDKRNIKGKTLYSVGIYSNDAIAIMKIVYPIMGARRQLQIEGVINNWKSQKQHLTRLSNEEISEIRSFYATGKITQKELATKYGVIPQTILRIVNYQRHLMPTKG
jgi:hypothetical protein